MHGNTHVPIAVGALHRHEVTGEPIFRLLAEQFVSLLNSTRTFATGGSTHHENWPSANRLGHLLGKPPHGTMHQESCVTHNTLTLATDLFRASREPRYAEFMERLQLNGVMGTQRGRLPGQMLYFYPLGTGVTKTEVGDRAGMSGWSHPTNYFSCCMGTGIEAHSKLQSDVFFTSSAASSAPTAANRANPAVAEAAAQVGAEAVAASKATELWIASFVSSELHWHSHGLAVRLEVRGAGELLSSDSRLVEVNLTLSALRGRTAGTSPPPSTLTLVRVRVPLWARAAHQRNSALGSATSERLRVLETSLSSGEALVASTDPAADHWSFAVDGSMLLAHPDVQARIRLQLPVELHAERLQDSRCKYRDLHALLYGPLVLAGLTSSDELQGRVEDLHASIRPVPLVARQELVSLSGQSGGQHEGSSRLGNSEGSRASDPLVTHLPNGALVLKPLRNPGYSFPEVRRGGSDDANAATFRLVRMENHTVALESFGRPNQYVGEADAGGGVRILLLRTVAAGAKLPRFRRHDGPNGEVLLESSIQPGAYVTMSPDGDGTLQLAAQSPQSPPLPLHVVPSAAEYPPASFWADAYDGRAVLLWPLNEMIDETYTVYSRLCPEDGCPLGRSKRQAAAWKVAKGFLISSASGDLFQKSVTVDEAQALCAADPKCTSFTLHCGEQSTQQCKQQRGTVYFKSFESPEDMVGQASSWLSFYLSEPPPPAGSSPDVVECEYDATPRQQPVRCKQQKAAGAPWRAFDGSFLVASREGDLYEKQLSLAEAKQLCASDERCTSFSTKCVSSSCAQEPEASTFWFKSYDAPQEKLQRGPPGSPRWVSFVVQTTKVCTGGLRST